MFTCLCRGGICIETATPMSTGVLLKTASLGPPLLPVVISKSVGKPAANLPADVKVIQRALNHVAEEDGGPSVLLKVDGFYGTKTGDAIVAFQLEQLGPVVADGLIQPLKRTNQALNTCIGKRLRQQTLEEFIVTLGVDLDQGMASLKQAFADAKSWLTLAALRIRSRDDPIVEKYFQISKQPSVYSSVAGVVMRMKQAIDRQDIDKVFRPEPLLRAGDQYAWCENGGFFMDPNETLYIDAPDGQRYPVPHRAIFITPIFIYMLSQVGTAYAIVHELAHWCSKEPFAVRDVQVQHRDPDKFAKLGPALRIRNADHYAMFAYELSTGRDATPLIP